MNDHAKFLLIKNLLSSGKSEEEIKTHFKERGLLDDNFDLLFKQAVDTSSSEPTSPAPSTPTTPQEATEQDQQIERMTDPTPSAHPEKVERLSSISDLFRNSWTSFRKNMGIFLGITASMIVFGFIFAFLFVFLTGGSAIILSSSFSFEGLFVGAGISIIIFIIFLILEIWIITALIQASLLEEPNMKLAFSQSWNKVYGFIWVSFLVGFILFGGFILLIIPGILFLVWFYLAQYVYIAEDVRGMNALLKSKEYVRGRWWPVCGRILMLFVAIFALSLLGVLIFDVLFKSPALSAIYGFVTNLLMIPFSVVYIATLYKELRALKPNVVVPQGAGAKAPYILVGLVGIILIIALPFVVLTSLNSARNAGSDAAIKSNLNNARAQAEIYYADNGNSYSDVCTKSMFENGIKDFIDSAESISGTADCDDSEEAWAAESRLDNGSFYCVDSSGDAYEIAFSKGSEGLGCPGTL